MFVSALCKFTFLNQSEPNFAHISPFAWKRPQGTYCPKMFDLFYPFFTFVRSECRILGTKWLPAQESSATALYP